MGGSAPVIDGSGNIFFSVGNGSFDGTGGTNRASVYGESVVKLSSSTSSGLKAVDYYTPNDYVGLESGGPTVCTSYGPSNVCPTGSSLNLGSGAGAGDLDLGSGGVTLLKPFGVPQVCGSNQEQLVAGGKEGVIYGVCASTQTTNTLQTIMGGWDGCGYTWTGTCNGATNQAYTACTQSSTPGTGGAIAQCFQGVNAGQNLGTILSSPGIHGPEAFWGGSASWPGLNYLYVAGAGSNTSNTKMEVYQPNSTTGLFNPAGDPDTYPKTYPWPGTVPAVSWDSRPTGAGPTATGLVWAIDAGTYGHWSYNKATNSWQSYPASPAMLVAYEAVPQKVNNVTSLLELWESDTLSSNYGPGAVKFSVPTIANGLVFVGGGASGYAPGPLNGTNVTCTSAAQATANTPECQGMLSVYGIP